MGNKVKSLLMGLTLAIWAVAIFTPSAHAASAFVINRQVDTALSNLYAGTPAALALSQRTSAHS